MEKLPTTVVSNCVRTKPRLLVFDDDVYQLANYCGILDHKYDVEGVLVSGRASLDASLKEVFGNSDQPRRPRPPALEDACYECIRHVVTSRDELDTLLQERRPDYVLSDFQMRTKDEPLSGIDVMHAVARLLPEVRRAVHTGAACALRGSQHFGESDRKDYQALSKAMQEDGFELFPKPLSNEIFDPRPIEAYWAGARGHGIG